MTGRIVRWAVGLLIVLLIGFRLTVFTVRKGQVAVVERLGRVKRVILEPDWYSKWFWPVEAAHRFDNRRRLFTPTYTETLTGDQRNIIVWSYVVWSIDSRDTEATLRFVESFKATKVGAKGAIEDAELALNSIILDAQNAVIGTYDLSALISIPAVPTQRTIEAVEKGVVQTVKAECENFGVRLHQFGFKRLAFPESTVKEALVGMRVKRLTEATRHRNAGEERAREIGAATDLKVAEIEADAIRRRLETLGQARADEADILMQAHGLDPDFYEWWRSLEASMKSITPRTRIIWDTRSPPFAALKQANGPEGVRQPLPTTQPVVRVPEAGGTR